MKLEFEGKEFFWVIGGGALQVPLIREVKELGYKVIVTDANKECICSESADIFDCIDIFNIKGHIRWAKKIVKNGINIKGVLAAGIDAHETMACLSEYLSLPGVSPEISHLVSNKDLFRKEMHRISIDTPIFEVVSLQNIDSLEEIVKKVGFPLIVKNTSSSGSRGTKIFYEPDQIGIKNMALEAISVSRSKKALIESLWVGTEHTVETIFNIEGKFFPCFITDRNFDKSKGFALETGLIHPSQLPTEIQEEIYELAKKVSKKLGINQGAAKFDLIQTRDGPKIIEMTLRLSGGYDCQYLVPAATGKNILKAAILTALGKVFDKDLLKNNKHRVAISESLWPNPGKIVEISGLEEAQKLPGFEHIFFRNQVGDIVETYINCTKRVCFIIVSGKNLEEASLNMEKIKSTIQIKTIGNE